MQIKPCRVIQRHVYVCAGCGEIYNDHAKAQECAKNGLPQTSFRPGDVVRGAGNNWGWYDNWRETPWVIRRPTKKGEFLHPQPYTYEKVWVIVAIEVVSHQVRLHMVSLGGSSKEHRIVHAWTSTTGHYLPIKMKNPSKAIVNWWKQNKNDWEGKLAEGLS